MGRLFGPTHYTEDELAEEGFRSLGRNVRIARNCTIVGAENIVIGDNVRIDGYCTIVAAGKGYLEIGSYIHIGGYCVLLAGEGITMADFSCLSWGCMLFSRSDDFSGKYLTNPMVPAMYTNAGGGTIEIGRHSIIGAGSIILPKVKISEGVAVGAQTLVNKDLAAWGVYTGMPARFVKERKRDLLDLEKELLAEINR